ncbi:pyridoxamine 5'-phosphate oxidase family protein [Natrononativus amylolyticus]|uniref:pyridoxamine 5'-phosphate oxidase family protein n=1 Tax=Natrononativus amylolyticus TaxID=2963434 RepID=UPI0020CE638A|nr:pyridoxamine 5'-phosphate oxidase family protein [Natrononativus amylolyticus]
MQGLRWLQMTPAEVDELLGRGGTGVISFAAGVDTPPVSIPVSYGYKADDRALYFQLSVPPESRKAELVDRHVSFFTYRETDDGWRSVIATGSLDALEDAPYASSAVLGMWAIEVPRVDIFERPREEVAFRDFCLVPDTLTGRKETETET